MIVSRSWMAAVATRAMSGRTPEGDRRKVKYGRLDLTTAASRPA